MGLRNSGNVIPAAPTWGVGIEAKEVFPHGAVVAEREEAVRVLGRFRDGGDRQGAPGNGRVRVNGHFDLSDSAKGGGKQLRLRDFDPNRGQKIC